MWFIPSIAAVCSGSILGFLYGRVLVKTARPSVLLLFFRLILFCGIAIRILRYGVYPLILMVGVFFCVLWAYVLLYCVGDHGKSDTLS